MVCGIWGVWFLVGCECCWGCCWVGVFCLFGCLFACLFCLFVFVLLIWGFLKGGGGGGRRCLQYIRSNLPLKQEMMFRLTGAAHYAFLCLVDWLLVLFISFCLLVWFGIFPPSSSFPVPRKADRGCIFCCSVIVPEIDHFFSFACCCCCCWLVGWLVGWLLC